MSFEEPIPHSIHVGMQTTQDPTLDKVFNLIHEAKLAELTTLLEETSKQRSDLAQLLSKHNDFRSCFTPLHVASVRGMTPFVSLLLSYGSNVNAQEFWKETPLLLACKNCHADVIRILLDAGARPSARGWYDRSALMFVVRNGGERALASLEVLLEKAEWDLNDVDGDGKTVWNFIGDHERGKEIRKRLEEYASLRPEKKARSFFGWIY